MRISSRIPEQYVVAKGAGQSNFGPGIDPWETASYDLALLDAGIENFNVMKYTSVLPPQAKEISLQEAQEQNLLRHGMVLESIMAQINGKHGEHLCAGVGTMKVYLETLFGKELVGGFAAEYQGHESEDRAAQRLREALAGIYDRRYKGEDSYSVGEIEIHTKSMVVDEDFGTVLVALGFVSFIAVEVKG